MNVFQSRRWHFSLVTFSACFLVPQHFLEHFVKILTLGLSVTLASRLQKEGTARVLCRVLLLLEQAEAEKNF